MTHHIRWLVEHESDICDPVRGTTNSLPFDVDYEDLQTEARAGNLDWVVPAFTYRSGKARFLMDLLTRVR